MCYADRKQFLEKNSEYFSPQTSTCICEILVCGEKYSRQWGSCQLCKNFLHKIKVGLQYVTPDELYVIQM